MFKRLTWPTVLLAACFLLRDGIDNHAGGDELRIFKGLDYTGTCFAIENGRQVEDEGALMIKAKPGEKFVWRVHNLGTVDASITLKGFKSKMSPPPNGSKPEDPGNWLDNYSSTSVIPAGKTKDIPAQFKTSLKKDHLSYAISVKMKGYKEFEIDPELIIEGSGP